ncbi:MAG: transposase [Tannerella sp.]|nr:transposase [Tannerella sp.]
MLYAYLNSIYSCRKIAGNIREYIHCMWLSGMQEPDFHTVNTFRSSHLKGAISRIYTISTHACEYGLPDFEHDLYGRYENGFAGESLPFCPAQAG